MLTSEIWSEAVRIKVWNQFLIKIYILKSKERWLIKGYKGFEILTPRLTKSGHYLWNRPTE